MRSCSWPATACGTCCPTRRPARSPSAASDARASAGPAASRPPASPPPCSRAQPLTAAHATTSLSWSWTWLFPPRRPTLLRAPPLPRLPMMRPMTASPRTCSRGRGRPQLAASARPTPTRSLPGGCDGGCTMVCSRPERARFFPASSRQITFWGNPARMLWRSQRKDADAQQMQCGSFMCAGRGRRAARVGLQVFFGLAHELA